MTQPALDYHSGDSLRPEQRLARYVARFLVIACLLQGLFVVCEQAGRPYLEVTGLAPSPLGVYGNLRASVYGTQNLWLFVVAIIQSLLFVSAFVVVIASAGLIARGHSFRRMAVIALLLFAVVKLAVDLMPFTSYWIDAMHRPTTFRLNGSIIALRRSPSTEQLIGTAFGTIAMLSGVVLPIAAALILTRRWMIDALSVDAIEAGAFGVRAAGAAAIVSGLGGLVLPTVLGLTQYHIDFYESLDALAIGYFRFNEVWELTAMFVLLSCSIASLIGGVSLVRGRKNWAKIVLWQARVAVIFNAVNTLITISLTVFKINNGYGTIVSTAVLMRLTSLSIDAILWLYLGSRGVKEFFREVTDPADAIPMAATVGS